MGKEKNYIVTASSLNIRPVPGTYYEPIGNVAHGEKIISPDIEGWVPILLEDDTIGWVAGKYLQEAPLAAPQPEEQEKPAPAGPQVGIPFLQSELSDMFGTPNYQQFARKNIVKIDLSEFADSLAHVRAFNGEPFTSINGHHLLAEPLKMALRLVCERGRAQELKTYDGCFNIRPMKSSGSLSVHSWGLALDFNAQTSPFQTENSKTWPDLVTDFSDAFVSCFAEAGFEWGGLWTSIHDPMHFQLPWTQDWQESSEPLRPVALPQVAPVAEAPEPVKTIPRSGELDFSTKDGTIAAITAECQRQGLDLPEQVAYVLATTEWETAHTFKPVKEAYWKDEAWRRQNLSKYYPYYGRGYVQLTWEANYRKYAQIMGLDLVGDPNLALEPNNAMFILVHGFRTGAFTGKKITDYINSEETDFYNARRCINRLDRAEEIAALAEKFLET
jgi:hypothetical protein